MHTQSEVAAAADNQFRTLNQVAARAFGRALICLETAHRINQASIELKCVVSGEEGNLCLSVCLSVVWLSVRESASLS